MTDSLSSFKRYLQEVDAGLSLQMFIALILGMAVVSDLGIFSVADGVLYALALSILLPSLTPYLLVALCTFQDVAGLSMLWWYGGTVLLGGLVAVRVMIREKLEDAAPGRLFLLFVFAALVIVYAMINSLIQDHLHGHPQSTGRPPMFVAGLMIGMMIAGISAFAELSRDGQLRVRLTWLVVILVANGVFVALAKAAFGLEMFASDSGLKEVQEAAQLTEASALGIPRLIGTYLTPNGFALCYGLIMLLLLVRQNAISERFILCYSIVGGVLGVFSLSKAMTVFFLFTAIILLTQSRHAKLVFTMGFIALLTAVPIFLGGGNNESLLEAFRVPIGDDGELGYRGQAWQLVTQTFSAFDWLFGTGLAYWGILFEQNLGFSLSDPHTYILSIPGTYGVLGVMFYIFVGATLARVAWNRTGAERALSLVLLVLIFVKDLASIPYLIGNTPLTLLIWLLIAGAMRGDVGRGAGTGRT